MIRNSKCFMLGLFTGAAASGIFFGSMLVSFSKKLKKGITITNEDDTIEEIPFDDISDDMDQYEATLKEEGYDTEV